MSRVLLVDDEPVLVALLRHFLTSKGHTVSTASDGLEAIRLVREERPQVVLLDINLPRMDGLEVLRRIRKAHPRLAVIVVSGLLDEETRQQALALGALDYLTKPVSFRPLERRLAAMSA